MPIAACRSVCAVARNTIVAMLRVFIFVIILLIMQSSATSLTSDAMLETTRLDVSCDVCSAAYTNSKNFVSVSEQARIRISEHRGILLTDTSNICKKCGVAGVPCVVLGCANPGQGDVPQDASLLQHKKLDITSESKYMCANHHRMLSKILPVPHFPGA